MQLKTPVIVVSCKSDLVDEVRAAIIVAFPEIEACIKCSTLRKIKMDVVSYYAQEALLHPIAPLFDHEAQSLKPRYVRALKRIFILCDIDKDGALSDVEFNEL
nr:unnamed protein product [Digitaria exilis]